MKIVFFIIACVIHLLIASCDPGGTDGGGPMVAPVVEKLTVSVLDSPEFNVPHVDAIVTDLTTGERFITDQNGIVILSMAASSKLEVQLPTDQIIFYGLIVSRALDFAELKFFSDPVSATSSSDFVTVEVQRETAFALISETEKTGIYYAVTIRGSTTLSLEDVNSRQFLHLAIKNISGDTVESSNYTIFPIVNLSAESGLWETRIGFDIDEGPQFTPPPVGSQYEVRALISSSVIRDSEVEELGDLDQVLTASPRFIIELMD